MASARDLKLARLAKRHGADYSLRIIWEARRAGISISLAFALVEQESGFRNVFGHDPVKNPVKGGKVTKKRYLEYRRYRKLGLGMQGVGLTQPTWYTYQDAADRLGGCWVPKNQLRVCFRVLGGLIRQHGYAKGIERYNGAGPMARRYSVQVRARARKWHHRFT